jgi:hypothetical protein
MVFGFRKTATAVVGPEREEEGYQGKEEKEDVQEKRGWKLYEQP